MKLKFLSFSLLGPEIAETFFFKRRKMGRKPSRSLCVGIGLRDEPSHLEQAFSRCLWESVQIRALNWLCFPDDYFAFQIKRCFLLLKSKSAKHWTCFVRHTSRGKIFQCNDMTWHFKADNKWHLVNATNLLFPLLYLCVAVGYHIRFNHGHALNKFLPEKHFKLP